MTNTNLHAIDYTHTGYKAGNAIFAPLYPECEIQITRADKLAGWVTMTIMGQREGNTVRGRISSFIDMARREKAAVMIISDNDDQADTMRRLMCQAMPEMQCVDADDFVSDHVTGAGLSEVIRHAINRVVEVRA